MIGPFFDMFTGAMFFFLSEIPKNVQNRLAHVDWDFMKVGLQACQASWGWWMQVDSVPSDQKFFMQMKFIFLLGQPAPIISSLFTNFCLFRNAILHKILKYWNNEKFWNIEIMKNFEILVAIFFSLVLVISFESIFSSYN